MTNNRIYYICNIFPNISTINYELNQHNNSFMFSKNSITKKEVSIMIDEKIEEAKKELKKEMSKIISNRIKTHENSKIGKILEENIRNILLLKFKWEKSKIPREFCFRKIYGRNIEGSSIINKDRQISLIDKDDNEFLYFKFLESDKSCEIIDLKNRKIMKINTKKKNVDIDTLGITISSVRKIEMDGIFILPNFELPNFISEEVKLIFNNININNREEIVNVIIEVKLNKKKLLELIHQIKYDAYVMKQLIKNKIIFIGFIGAGDDNDDDEDIIFEEELGNLNCAIYEIKSDYIFGKNVKQYIDWNLVKDVEEIKKKLNEIYDLIKKEKEEKLKNKKMLGKKTKKHD